MRLPTMGHVLALIIASRQGSLFNLLESQRGSIALHDLLVQKERGNKGKRAAKVGRAQTTRSVRRLRVVGQSRAKSRDRGGGGVACHWETGLAWFRFRCWPWVGIVLCKSVAVPSMIVSVRCSTPFRSTRPH